MKRKLPSHILKRYEALGCVADGRIVLWPVVEDVITAKVTSSDGTKIYDVSYLQSEQMIMSNDNTSYRKEELWYPALALLLFLDVLDYQDQYGTMLIDIPRKRLNVQNNNDRDITQSQIDEKLKKWWYDLYSLYNYCDSLAEKLQLLDLSMLWEKQQPAQ